jgi:hypothetical protein
VSTTTAAIALDSSTICALLMNAHKPLSISAIAPSIGREVVDEAGFQISPGLAVGSAQYESSTTPPSPLEHTTVRARLPVVSGSLYRPVTQPKPSSGGFEGSFGGSRGLSRG